MEFKRSSAKDLHYSGAGPGPGPGAGPTGNRFCDKNLQQHITPAEGDDTGFTGPFLRTSSFSCHPENDLIICLFLRKMRHKHFQNTCIIIVVIIVIIIIVSQLQVVLKTLDGMSVNWMTGRRSADWKWSLCVTVLFCIAASAWFTVTGAVGGGV